MTKQGPKYRLPASPFKSPAISAGDAATGVLQKIFASRGFGTHQIVSNWQAIVGDELAEMTAPEKLRWTRQASSNVDGEGGQTAILHLRVEGPLAIEIQHMAGQIIERINSYLGAPMVQSLRILQAPLARRPLARQKTMPVLAAPEDEQGDSLESALTRLGNAVGKHDK